LAVARRDPSREIFIFEDESSDPHVYAAAAEALPGIVSDAWYPSNEIYLCDPEMDWCLVLTNYNTIGLYLRPGAADSVLDVAPR
jgi:hypothetical protein